MPLLLFNSRAAAVWGSGRSLLSARPQGEDREAFQPLRKLDSRERGIRDAVLFLSATSLTTMMRRWVVIPRLGQGFLVKRHRALRWVVVPAVTARAEPANASAWVRPERDQTLRTHRPMTGAINSNHRTGAQQPEGSAPNR